MKVQVFKYWDRVRSSFWFLPAVMVGSAVGLSFGSVALDERVTNRWLLARGWTFTGGPEGASSVLSVIAGSMITLAGVVFSMTLVALSLASSQLGPRLLRNFMRDTPTQIVLGTFVATFLYCLLVLRTVRHADEIAFVPHLSVTLGVALAVVSVGVLIYFIHHVAVITWPFPSRPTRSRRASARSRSGDSTDCFRKTSAKACPSFRRQEN